MEREIGGVEGGLVNGVLSNRVWWMLEDAASLAFLGGLILVDGDEASPPFLVGFLDSAAWNLELNFCITPRLPSGLTPLLPQVLPLPEHFATCRRRVVLFFGSRSDIIDISSLSPKFFGRGCAKGTFGGIDDGPTNAGFARLWSANLIVRAPFGSSFCSCRSLELRIKACHSSRYASLAPWSFGTGGGRESSSLSVKGSETRTLT